MGKSYFITSTDTDVGKTFIGAGLARSAKNDGLTVGVYKPISSGGLEDPRFYINKAGICDPIDLINPIKFRQSLSPYAALKTEKRTINLKSIKMDVDRLAVSRDLVIVEGLGGVLAPIMKDLYVADLIEYLKMPCIIIARAGLGTINHTLLTIEALKKRKVNIKGIIMNGYSGRDISEKTNAQVIEELSGVKVIGRIKAKSTFNSLVKQIEKQNILGKLL